MRDEEETFNTQFWGGFIAVLVCVTTFVLLFGILAVTTVRAAFVPDRPEVIEITSGRFEMVGYRGPQKNPRAGRPDKGEFELGNWVKVGRVQYRLQVKRTNAKKVVEYKTFELCMDVDGVWHGFEVGGIEWHSIATVGLLTAKQRFWKALKANGWSQATEGEKNGRF